MKGRQVLCCLLFVVTQAVLMSNKPTTEIYLQLVVIMSMMDLKVNHFNCVVKMQKISINLRRHPWQARITPLKVSNS